MRGSAKSITLIVILFFGLLLFAGIFLNNQLFGPVRDEVAYKADCTDFSILLKFHVIPNFIEGNFVTYGLYYQKDQKVDRLYEVMSPMRYDRGEFYPVPENSNLPSLVIERPDVSQRAQWRNRQAPLLNIFLDPTKFTQADFTKISECVATHSSEINSNLVLMKSMLPRGDQKYYETLRVGGVALGLPPENDPLYISLIRKIKGVSETYPETVALPTNGMITLFSGQSAVSQIGNSKITLKNRGDGFLFIQKNDEPPMEWAKWDGAANGFSVSPMGTSNDGSMVVHIFPMSAK